LVKDVLNHLKNSSKIKKKENKHALTRIILSNDLKDYDIENACNDYFKTGVFSFSDKDVVDEFQKYLNLYHQRVAMAEVDLESRNREKEENRDDSMMIALYSFGTIVSIATILLLFSIQSILRKNTNND
jgi:hypothetical protein